MLKSYLLVFFVSMVPLIELRGAIPIGLGMGLPILPTYLVCVVGNMIPVPFIYLFARKFLIWGYHKPLIGPICKFCIVKGEKGGRALEAKAGRGLVVALLAIHFICGQPLDLYLLQLPVAMVLMFVFFDMFSLMTSLLSAISKDFMNLLKTLSTPLFWLSGIIFNVFNLGIPAIELILMFNPITFIVTMYRCAVYDKMWIWDKPEAIIGFVIVFVVTAIATAIIYRRTHEEVADVL